MQLQQTDDREQTIKDLVWRYYDDCWNRGDFAIVDEFAGRFETCGNNLWSIDGPEGIKASMQRLRDGLSDLSGRIDEWFVQTDVSDPRFGLCDRLSIWWTVEGRFNGEIMGIAPTGKNVVISGSSLLWLKDMKLIAARACSDIYQKLGSLPPDGGEA